MSVAETILQQLGGRRFLAMTGAKHLIGSADTLSMQVNGRYANAARVNGVRITLEQSDTYRVDAIFFSRKTLQHTVIVSRSFVYADQLGATFEALTGLAVRL